MIRCALLLLLLCGLPAIATAQSVTFDFGRPQTHQITSVEQETMARLLAEINRQRAANRPPLPEWTVEDWQMFVLQNALSSYASDVKVLYAEDGCGVFAKNVDEQTKTEVLAYFGGLNPCAPSRR